MLTRSLCRFGRFDLAQVPAARRHSALRLKLVAWAPFAEAAYAVVWVDGLATVWCWDAARLRERLAPHGRRPDQFSAVVPETLLQAPMADGLRLVRCLEGFDAQHWQARALMDSRWWPALPTAVEWLGFLRGSGVAFQSQTPLPPPMDLPWLPRPWAAVSAAAEDDGSLSGWEPWVQAVLVAALGVPAALLATRELQLHLSTASLEQQINALRQTASPLLSAREAALDTLQSINLIQDVQRYPDALRVMTTVAQFMPADGVLLREWELSDGSLRFMVVSATAPIVGTEHVAALERAGYFQDVKMIAQADPRQMGFAMRLRTLRELDSPAAPPAARP